ncbi:MAG: efflux RND transporter periplasmic adaptor subunit [Planctomycetota bacterium]|nr:MAG: efflux RND transporter periplasmic adaptor subunit [Planctomycetota bacterium]REJ89040.1 MAG: efflux RND transporter periplasmic adaptor subunit [Planctomycetota bacterium]REK29023.1 MAG: efflux RND transporter periplasmic adaptor subunit [Planctomycetota bacterium]REK39547.1 MAG: efflux RND transporter periplasmic adaptor subunit [Planctomycetota bacterium]
MRILHLISRTLLGLAAIAACWGAWWIVYTDSRALMETENTDDAEEVVTVEVMPVRTATLEERIELVGSLEAKNEVAVHSRVNGYITALPYDVGDDVAAGRDVVFIDDTEQLERVANMEAALLVAEAELRASKSEHALAQRTLTRVQGLVESGAGTEREVDAAEGALDIAAARVELNEARVREAESNLRQAKLEANDLKIASPISGKVAQRFVDTGALAQPANPLLVIVDLETIQTAVHIVEKDYDRVQTGQTAVIRVDAFPDRTFHGEVARIAPVIDPETRTALVQVEIPNPDHLLKPGMHARVGIVFRSKQGSGVVPVDAVVEAGEKPAVFVVSGEPPQAELREVRTGINDGDVIEILEGLRTNERIVTLGNRLLRHGQRVNPEEVPWPSYLQAVSADAGAGAPLTPSQ